VLFIGGLQNRCVRDNVSISVVLCSVPSYARRSGGDSAFNDSSPPNILTPCNISDCSPLFEPLWYFFIPHSRYRKRGQQLTSLVYIVNRSQFKLNDAYRKSRGMMGERKNAAVPSNCQQLVASY